MRLLRPMRAFTLIETTVAIGISVFVFAFCWFLLFAVSRNLLNVHEQVTSQSSAASASERIATELRKAVYFSAYAQDIVDTSTVHRVRYAIPLTRTTVTTGTIAYNKVKHEVCVYSRELGSGDFDFNGNPRPTPNYIFRGISNFEITWQNEYRLTLAYYFQYRGFALMFSNPGNPQYGQFITDIQARNHFFDQRESNYAAYFASPATL